MRRPNWISYQDIMYTKKQCCIEEVWIHYYDQREYFTQISDYKPCSRPESKEKSYIYTEIMRSGHYEFVYKE